MKRIIATRTLKEFWEKHSDAIKTEKDYSKSA